MPEVVPYPLFPDPDVSSPCRESMCDTEGTTLPDGDKERVHEMERLMGGVGCTPSEMGDGRWEMSRCGLSCTWACRDDAEDLDGHPDGD